MNDLLADVSDENVVYAEDATFFMYGDYRNLLSQSDKDVRRKASTCEKITIKFTSINCLTDISVVKLLRLYQESRSIWRHHLNYLSKYN